jgi:hypothetical protein
VSALLLTCRRRRTQSYAEHLPVSVVNRDAGVQPAENLYFLLLDPGSDLFLGGTLSNGDFSPVNP